jgi:hypothetical protein
MVPLYVKPGCQLKAAAMLGRHDPTVTCKLTLPIT